MASNGLQPQTQTNPPGDFAEIWNEAVNEYCKTTRRQIKDLNGANNLNNISDRLKTRERAWFKYRTGSARANNIRMIAKKWMEPIGKIAPLIGAGSSAAFPASVAISGVVGHLIKSADGVSADYDEIEIIFEEISSYLERWAPISENLPPFPELKSAIAKVFGSILILCGNAEMSIEKKRTKKWAKSLFFKENEEFVKTSKEFRRKIQAEDRVIAAIQLRYTQEGQVDMKKVLVTTERTLEDTKTIIASSGLIQGRLESQAALSQRTEIIRHLSQLDFYEKHNARLMERHQNTGQWFLETNEFKQWLGSTNNSLLWCSGNPGVGKSIITSITVNHIQNSFKKAGTAVVYIYFDYKDPKTQSKHEIIASIARQLAEQIDPIPLQLKDFHEANVKKRRMATEAELISLIKSLCTHFKSTFIFIDALDELLEENNRIKFLRSIKEIQPLSRLFITSRPHVDPGLEFPQRSRIHIAASSSDIGKYVESEIDINSKLRSFTAADPKLKDEIINNVVEKASGMFLLVNFHIKEICGQISPTRVRQTLSTLPRKMYEAYENEMTRIDKKSEPERRLAKMALSYIFYAIRPVTVDELLHALAVDPHDTELDDFSITSTTILRDVCAGLIKAGESSDNAELIHASLNDYLQEYADEHRLPPESELARTCLTYLSFDTFRLGSCGDADSLSRRLQKYRFLDYASHNWGYHVANNQPPLLTTVLTFLEDAQRISSFVQVLYLTSYMKSDWYKRFPRQFGPLHIAAYWGIDSLVADLLQKGIDINSKDTYGVTALQLAARNNHDTLLQILLKEGAHVNSRNKKGETALTWAARKGHTKIVGELLRYNANIKLKDDDGWTALDWAVTIGNHQLVKILLEHHVFNNAESSILATAFIQAASEGHEGIAQTLLEYGVDANIKDKNGSTALDWAVTHGHDKVVGVLLSNKADVNSRDAYRNTALHWAVRHEGIAKLLIEHGADINAKNNIGHTPLSWAVQDGLPEVVELLLQNQADVNSKENSGFTALHRAAMKGHEALVKLLLKNGANIASVDRDGWTPLHVAAMKEHSEVLNLIMNKSQNKDEIAVIEWVAVQFRDHRRKALLEKKTVEKSLAYTAVSPLGAAVQDQQLGLVAELTENGSDVNGKDPAGWTPLILASCQGFDEAAKLLLMKGADPNITGTDKRTALHWAVSYGNESIVHLLIEHGSDVNAEAYGWTALLLAAKNGRPEISQFLLENGADARAVDYRDRTALHWAATNGDQLTLELLLAAGVELNAADCWGKTPLVYGIENGHEQAVRLLLESGVDINVKAQDGSTALHFATWMEDDTIVSLLIEGGAHIQSEDQVGITPMDIAVLLDSENIAELLRGKGSHIKSEPRWFAVDDGTDTDDGVFDGYEIDDPDDIDKNCEIYTRTEPLSKRVQKLRTRQKKVSIHA